MGRRKGRKPKSSTTADEYGGDQEKVPDLENPSSPITITMDTNKSMVTGTDQFIVVPNHEDSSEGKGQHVEAAFQEGPLHSTPDSGMISSSYSVPYDNLPLSPIARFDTSGIEGSLLLSPSTGPSFKTSTPLSSHQVVNPGIQHQPMDLGLTTPVKNTQHTPYQSKDDQNKLVNVKMEDQRINFTTPKRAIPSPGASKNNNNGCENSPDSDSGVVFNSPIFVSVRFDSSNDEEDNPADKEAANDRRYKLRPRRNLFPKALTLQRYQPPCNNLDNSEDEEDEVLFVLDDADSDYDDDEEEDDYGNLRRTTYGSRGPKADAKALSLISNCPTSVKWLVENFEYHPGKSLPRGFVYDQYILLCSENGLDPLNAASFGKLIRSVFPGLKTRRLGTRGNSKYHYNGVYLRGASPLLHIMNLMRTQEGLMYDNSGKRGRRVRKAIETGAGRPLPKTIGQEMGAENYLGCRPALDRFHAHLNVDIVDIPRGLDPSVMVMFEHLYNVHCKALLAAFANFDLKEVFDEWKRFWRVTSGDGMAAMGYNEVDYSVTMSKATLFKVCSLKGAAEFINLLDLTTYQLIIEILFPNMYRAMPGHMAHALKTMMKVVIVTMMKILDGYPKIVVDLKLSCLKTWMQMWYDYSKLNRMVGAVEQTLHFEDSVQIMRTELSRCLDFEQLTEEASNFQGEATWSLVAHLLINFQTNLEDADQSVEGWVMWTEALVDKLVNGNHVLFERSCLPKICRCWKFASDSMVGAIVKVNAATLGVLKVLVTWCDSLIVHMVMLETARCQGFTMPIFYYASLLMDPNDMNLPQRPRPALMAITYPSPKVDNTNTTSNRNIDNESESVAETRNIRSCDLNDDQHYSQKNHQISETQGAWNNYPTVGGPMSPRIIVEENGKGRELAQCAVSINPELDASKGTNEYFVELQNTMESTQNHGDPYNSNNLLVLDSEMFSDDQLLGFFQENSSFINNGEPDIEDEETI